MLTYADFSSLKTSLTYASWQGQSLHAVERRGAFCQAGPGGGECGLANGRHYQARECLSSGSGDVCFLSGNSRGHGCLKGSRNHEGKTIRERMYHNSQLKGKTYNTVAVADGGAAAAPLPSGSSEAVPGGVLGSVLAGAAAPSSWPAATEEAQEAQRRVVAGIDQATLKDPKELADADSLFIQFRGVDIHYKKSEPFGMMSEEEQDILGEDGTTMVGKPAVFLHGFGASVFSWEKVLKPIASLLGAPAIAFDRPAFGLTSRMKPPGGGPWGTTPPERNPYSLAFSADASLAFSKMLLERGQDAGKGSILIAHSAGSAIACRAAIDHPEMVAALVLVAPALFAPLLANQRASKSLSPYAKEQEEEAYKFRTELEASKHIAERKGKRLKSLPKTVASIIAAVFSLILGKIGLAVFWVGQKLRDTGKQIQSWVEDSGSKAYRWLDDRAGHAVARSARYAGSFVWGVVKWIVAHAAWALFWAARNAKVLLGKAWSYLSLGVYALWAVGLRSKAGLWMIRRSIGQGGTGAVRLAWHDKLGCTQRVLDAYTKPIMCRDWDRALLEFVIANSSPFSNSISNRLQDIQCPVLIVTGDDDKLVPAWNARRLAKVFPRAVFRIIPKCGHLPQEETPKQLVALIREFILQELINVNSTNGVPSFVYL